MKKRAKAVKSCEEDLTTKQIGQGTFRIWDLTGSGDPVVVAWACRPNSGAISYWGYRPDYFANHEPKEDRNRAWLVQWVTSVPTDEGTFRSWVQNDASSTLKCPAPSTWKTNIESTSP